MLTATATATARPMIAAVAAGHYSLMDVDVWSERIVLTIVMR